MNAFSDPGRRRHFQFAVAAYPIQQKPLRVKFLARNGYPGEALRACEHGLIKGRKYEIEDCSIGQSRSSVKVLGSWYNSVLFDVTVSQLSMKFGDPYMGLRFGIPLNTYARHSDPSSHSAKHP